MKVKRPCAVCGKECAEYQRNTDGTYLHDPCAYATQTLHLDTVPPTEGVGSPGAKEEGT